VTKRPHQPRQEPLVRRPAPLQHRVILAHDGHLLLVEIAERTFDLSVLSALIAISRRRYAPFLGSPPARHQVPDVRSCIDRLPRRRPRTLPARPRTFRNGLNERRPARSVLLPSIFRNRRCHDPRSPKHRGARILFHADHALLVEVFDF